MRGTMLKLLACLLVAAIAAVPDAEAAQRTRSRKIVGDRPGEDKAYALEDIMSGPKQYLEREVLFYCRYATTANLFKNVNTRFNTSQHVNFAVWPDKAVLWEEKARKNLLPTLYVAKNDPESLDTLRDAKRYELLAVTGKVQNVYAGYPWILVTKIEKIEKPSDRLSQQVVEHMQAGHQALIAEKGGVAARHYEQAFLFGLPCEYRAKAFEQVAQAYLLDNKLDRARGYLRQAVEIDKGDPILHLALADVSLRMTEPGEALAHATFALERSGRYPQAYGIRGEAMSLLGDYAKAYMDLNTAAGTPGITPREKAMVNIRRARIYARSERYPDAARVYAAASEPGEPLAGEAWLHNEIGLFYERLFLETADPRYLDSAATAFEEGTKLNRLDPAILYNLAEVEYRRQKQSEAPDFNRVMQIIERVNQIEPDYAPARILNGRLLFAEGRIEEAEYRYQSVVNHISQDPMALLALSEAYLDLGRDGDAATTARRARALEPWNHRVQAIGRFLEEGASAMAQASGAAEEGVIETGPAEIIDERQWQDTDKYYQDVPEVYEYYGEANAETQPYAEVQPYVEPEAETRQWVEPPYAESPPPAVEQVQPQQKEAGDLRPKRSRLKRQQLAAGSLRPDYPQELQASVQPELLEEPRHPKYPVTEVVLPESVWPKREPAGLGLDLGFNPGTGDLLEKLPAPEYGEPFEDESVELFQWESKAIPENAPEMREVEVDDDGFLRFGMIRGVSGAYASMPLDFEVKDDDGAVLQADAVKLPPAFSFDPDDSPVLIAEVRVPDQLATREMPVRNANVYRRWAGGRRPAEIIEKEPIAPRLGTDTPAMVPPKSGEVRRAEVKIPVVRLPSSSRGLGATNDYGQGR